MEVSAFENKIYRIGDVQFTIDKCIINGEEFMDINSIKTSSIGASLDISRSKVVFRIFGIERRTLDFENRMTWYEYKPDRDMFDRVNEISKRLNGEPYVSILGCIRHGRFIKETLVDNVNPIREKFRGTNLESRLDYYPILCTFDKRYVVHISLLIPILSKYDQYFCDFDEYDIEIFDEDRFIKVNPKSKSIVKSYDEGTLEYLLSSLQSKKDKIRNLKLELILKNDEIEKLKSEIRELKRKSK